MKGAVVMLERVSTRATTTTTATSGSGSGSGSGCFISSRRTRLNKKQVQVLSERIRTRSTSTLTWTRTRRQREKTSCVPLWREETETELSEKHLSSTLCTGEEERVRLQVERSSASEEQQIGASSSNASSSSSSSSSPSSSSTSSVSSFEYKNGRSKTLEAETSRKEKISLANAGRRPWNVGVPHQRETKDKIGQTLRNTFAENPELVEVIRNRQQGKKHSLETREKIRNARLAQVRSKTAQTQRRKEVNEMWSNILCIQSRREELYYSRKRERLQAKRDKLLLSKSKSKEAKRGSRSGEKGNQVGVRKTKSDAHRKKISEAMKKKWRTKEFRKSVESGIASRTALKQRINSGNSSELVRSAKVERKVMLKRQEKLRQRAAELLAMAHAAAEHLKTIESREQKGGGEKLEGCQELSDLASVEIERALRSLDDAEALVSRLHKRSSMHHSTQK